jgi:hypothetical protein
MLLHADLQEQVWKSPETVCRRYFLGGDEGLTYSENPHNVAVLVFV